MLQYLGERIDYSTSCDIVHRIQLLRVNSHKNIGIIVKVLSVNDGGCSTFDI